MKPRGKKGKGRVRKEAETKRKERKRTSSKRSGSTGYDVVQTRERGCTGATNVLRPQGSGFHQRERK